MVEGLDLYREDLLGKEHSVSCDLPFNQDEQIKTG